MPRLGRSLLWVRASVSPTDGITPPQTSHKSHRAKLGGHRFGCEAERQELMHFSALGQHTILPT